MHHSPKPFGHGGIIGGAFRRAPVIAVSIPPNARLLGNLSYFAIISEILARSLGAPLGLGV